MTQVGLKKFGVLCVLHCADDLLLLKRSKEPHRGMYVPIGGHVEPFETPRDAIGREVREETGLLLDQIRFCGAMAETSPTKYNWVTFIYSAQVDRVPPPSCREGALEWVSRSRLPHITMPSTDMYIYELVLRQQPFVFDAEFDASLELMTLREEITGEMQFPRQ